MSSGPPGLLKCPAARTEPSANRGQVYQELALTEGDNGLGKRLKEVKKFYIKYAFKKLNAKKKSQKSSVFIRPRTVSFHKRTHTHPLEVLTYRIPEKSEQRLTCCFIYSPLFR